MAQNNRALAKRVVGRPPKLSEDVIDLVCAALRIGAPLTDACGAQGVSRQLFHEWRKRGEAARAKKEKGEPISNHEALCVRFLDALPLAVNEGVVTMLTHLATGATKPFTITTKTTKKTKIGVDDEGQPIYAIEEIVQEITRPPDPKWSAWRLANIHRENFHPMMSQELSGPDGEPVQVAVRIPALLERARTLREKPGVLPTPETEDPGIVDAEIVESALPPPAPPWRGD